MPGLLNARLRIGITEDVRGVASALAAGLQQRGCDAIVVHQPISDERVDALIFLGGLRDVETFDDAAAVSRDAFSWAKSVGSHLFHQGGLFITVQDTGGDFGRSATNGMSAWLGGLPGLVKTAGLEWPKAVVKAIDIAQDQQSPEATAARILDELFCGGPEIEVGLTRDGTRVTPVALPHPADHPTAVPHPIVNPDEVIVVSGGARGVTAAVIKELAQLTGPRIALLGRTTLVEEPEVCRRAMTDADLKRVLLAQAKEDGVVMTPRVLGQQVRAIQASREIRETVNHLWRVSSAVEYLAVDVQDEQAVSEAMASIRAMWGPITGLVHGAGVIHDKFIVDKPLASFDDVFRTKVHGLKALLSATESDDLRFLCLFSSIAARTGNIGQSDYAMANDILNKVAWLEAKRRGPACLVKSINWGAWKGGMVTPELQSHFENHGVPLIPLNEGARFFVDEIQAADSQTVEIVAAPEVPGLLGKSHQRTWVLELSVGQDTYPSLSDHAIDNTPVIPAVLVLHWFVSAAAACRPELSVEALERLQVVKGIRLPDFREKAETFSLTVREDQDEQGVRMEMTLHQQDGTLNYHGTVWMTAMDENASLAFVQPVPELQASATRDERFETLYPTHLFHGPAFQVIEAVQTVSDEGVLADLRSSGSQAGCHVGEQTLVPLLDGGLQAARLWGIHKIGNKTLPTAIGRYVPGGRAATSSLPCRCVVFPSTATALKTVSDVYFLAQDGAVAAAMLGVEMHATLSQ